MARRKKNYNT